MNETVKNIILLSKHLWLRLFRNCPAVFSLTLRPQFVPVTPIIFSDENFLFMTVFFSENSVYNNIYYIFLTRKSMAFGNVHTTSNWKAISISTHNGNCFWFTKAKRYIHKSLTRSRDQIADPKQIYNLSQKQLWKNYRRPIVAATSVQP